ncbi:hypothetical protein ACP70R_022788 [Stipagrostis hirtigluma subsp. patula]
MERRHPPASAAEEREGDRRCCAPENGAGDSSSASRAPSRRPLRPVLLRRCRVVDEWRRRQRSLGPSATGAASCCGLVPS